MVAVVVAAEHQVDAFADEFGDEQLADLLLAVPAVLLARDHVHQYDAHGGRPEFVAVDDLFQPFGLLSAVCVPVAHAVIAEIVVGFVLTAVEHDEEGRAAAERVVGLAGRRGEIVEPMLRISAAVLVVAARHGERNARGREDVRCRREAGIPERLLGLGLAGQVAVQADEIRTGLGGVPDQQLENGVAGVDVVDHPEIDFFLRRVEGPDGVGLAPEHFAAVPVVEDDALVALVQDDSPLHDAVAVGRAGPESFDPHLVHASDAAKSEVRVVIPGPLGRVEVRSVHRGEFDPADGVVHRVPDDREAVFGDIQYIGSVGDAHRRRHGGLGEGGGRQQKRAQQQGKSFHGESCIGSSFKGMFLFSFIQFFVLLIRKEIKYTMKRKFFRCF